ncbi:hypothetical protein JCM10908_002550 [Rhodotorula pacifica]|uniref:uncharacterized protein n=1 Tax=Rhodotorula pacifica TaxID=1495444 RepID=UPI003179F4AE
MTAFAYQQDPQDVCFDFPGINAKLWASYKLLTEQSPYYHSLLGGEFSEATVQTGSSATMQEDEPQDYQAIRIYEDSDDETDEHFQGQLAVLTQPKSSTILPHKKVIVADTACTTYLATLVWMGSRYVRFAPLRSSVDGSSGGTSESRLQQIITDTQANSRLPISASPKSIYRLAHLLELTDLQEAALDNLVSQLTPQNAATELFSDVASAYPALRDCILDFVVGKWAGLRASDAWTKIKELANAHELPAGAAYTALLLFERANGA